MFTENNNGLNNSEKVENRIENPRRMEKSADLIKNPIRDGEIGFDKVFIQADKIIQNGNKWQVDINSEDPTVIFDDKWRQDLGLKNSAVVPEIRNGNGEKNWFLVVLGFG